MTTGTRPPRARRRRMLHIPRKRVAPAAPTPRPLAAVLVALDVATCTGWAIYISGKLWAYGQVDARDPAVRSRVFADAIGAAYMRQMPVGVVLEVPWGGSVTVALSLHANVTRWRESWRTARQPDDRLIERTAGQWRRDLFGAHGGKMPRAQARAFEAALAEQVIARDFGARRFARPLPGPDAAAAICVGQTIIRSGELHRALGCGLVLSSRRVDV